MTVKTKPAPKRRTGSYRPRRSGSAPSRAGHRRRGIRSFSFRRPGGIWLLAGAGIGLVLAVVFIDALVNGAEAIVRTFGLGLPIVFVVLVIDARIFLYRAQFTPAFMRVFAGWHMLVLAAFGTLALFTPNWQIGDVDFSDATLGGSLGQPFTDSPIGLIAWVALTGTGASLIWPRRAAQVRDALMAGGRWMASLDLPQRAWHGLAAFAGALLPRTTEEYDRTLLEEPYIPQLDEEWEESSGIIEDDEEEEPATREPKNNMLVTIAEEDEPEGHQSPLPMGRPAGRGWELPPLAAIAEAADIEIRPVDNEARAQLIVDTLASFGVDARVVSINQGPTVTQFGVEPGWEIKTRSVPVKDERGKQLFDPQGRPLSRNEIVSKTRVRVNRITALANDLSLALAAPTIRIEAPVPGKPIVGIEVPNTTASLVSLRSVIESTAFQKVNMKSKLALALGKGVSGDSVAADLGKMPHLLIAGATGSGKSVCINSIIASFLLHNTPEELRLVLVDPKRVELTTYNRVPHLAFSKVIVDMDEVVGTLQAIIHEMDSRYRRFAEAGVRNIEAFNKSPRTSHKLPYWVVIIDELADLMMAAPYEVERQICRLAQLARATGIHLIVATQRPSVDVITGLIKANFPTRLAFAVSSQVDSRTIIDGVGAEKLLGRGDMLFMATDAAKPKRIQGSYVSDEDIEKIVDWWANDRFRHLAPDKLDHLLEEAKEEDEAAARASEEDPLYEAARELALQHSRVSTSLLQRRLHIGYPRAANLIDMLEEEGVVGPAESGQSRQVLIADREPDYDAFDEDADYTPDDDGRFE
jgi:DNA segregation ATPase FtsK/SpoIIIE, S-DNA-T family